MKTMITVLALSIASITTAMADIGPQNILCSTTPTRFGAVESVQITDISPYFAILTGTQSGGMAHFIRKIGPVNVKITHEVDMTTYENSEEGISLTIIANDFAGQLKSTGSFKEGNLPAVSMYCHLQ